MVSPLDVDFDVDTGRLIERSETLIAFVEVVAAYLLIVLFAVGVFDLGLNIVELVRTGRITDPRAVVGLIDVALLLFIIVEIYQTVVAYVEERSGESVLRTVIYAGVIAMVRKAIVFRTEEYATLTDALLAAASYTAILVGLAIVLLVSFRYGELG